MKQETRILRDYDLKMNGLEIIKTYDEKAVFKSYEDIKKFYEDYKDLDKEVLVVYFLNTRNKILRREVMAIGDNDESIFPIKSILKIALLINANCLIFSHNHPTGNINPSNDDIETTRKAKEGADIIGIKVLDHIIVGKGNKEVYSLCAEGDFR